MNATKKPTLSDIKRLAAKHGATIDWGGGEGYRGHFDRLYVDLPAGKHWKANETSQLDADFQDGNRGHRTEAYAALLEQMAEGVEPCPHGGCSECEGDEEETDS